MYHHSLYKDDPSDILLVAVEYKPRNTIEEALSEALDDLSAMYVESWPVEIRIYDSEESYVVQTKLVYEEDVKQHALRRIERANREEFGVIIEAAHAESRQKREQYERGLLTPLDFAKDKVGIWTKAWYDIESKG